MPDINTPEALAIRRQEAAARPRAASTKPTWPPSTFHDPNHVVRPARGLPAPPAAPAPPAPKPHPLRALTTKAIKLSLALDPAQFLVRIPEPSPGQSRVVLTIGCESVVLTADLSAKSVRRALKAIADANLAGEPLPVPVLQGRLGSSGIILEAGLAVQPRTPKPAPIAVHAPHDADCPC